MQDTIIDSKTSGYQAIWTLYYVLSNSSTLEPLLVLKQFSLQVEKLNAATEHKRTHGRIITSQILMRGSKVESVKD